MTVEQEIFEVAESKGVSKVHVETMLSMFRVSALATVSKTTGRDILTLADSDLLDIQKISNQAAKIKTHDEYNRVMQQAIDFFAPEGLDFEKLYNDEYSRLVRDFLATLRNE